MTSDPQQAEPRTQRKRLGRELRRLREMAGISGDAMGAVIHKGQATVSRVENGKAVIALPQVMAWADATRASPDARQLLTALTAAALNEVETWRTRMADEGLPAMQNGQRELESTAHTIRVFTTAIMPGLLQTDDYARRVFAVSDVLGTGDYAAAAARRLERQQILLDPAHQFEFLMTEAAVRWKPGSLAVHTAQIDRIEYLATLRNVTVGVLPQDVGWAGIAWTGFNIYEDRDDGQEPLVTIEVPHARLVATDPDDVAIYHTQLDLLRQAARWDGDAVTALQRIAAELTA